MAIEISRRNNAGPTEGSRPIATAMLRGAQQKCPACGERDLFRRYLKVVDTCPGCATELHHHRADDAPPYFTILVVGHIVVGGVLALERTMAPEAWVHALIWLPLTLVLSLTLLPRFKGMLVGLQWALRMHGFGTDPDPSAPEAIDTRPTTP
jgi:uncharacterized protein (DUF983 family)